MRIGVVSDTHGSLSTAIKLIREMGELDLLLHAGDYYRDAAALAREFNLPVRAVVGNCDLAAKGPVEEYIELAGWRISMLSTVPGKISLLPIYRGEWEPKSWCHTLARFQGIKC